MQSHGAKNQIHKEQNEANETTASKTTELPVIGVALGGGVARGWGHIGVLRALEEIGIIPQIVAGTSIGAVVAGCWAAGKLDALETFARSLTSRKVLGLLDLSIGGSGLINGRKLTRLLERDIGDISLENLSIKTIFVATELDTGHEIWLRTGNIVQAMHASYALPGIFNPVRMGDRWLVDGALVNPVPVSVCRAHGARFVLAVNLNSDVFGRGTVVPYDMETISSPAVENLEPNFSKNTTSMATAVKRFISRQLIGTRDGPPGISTVMIDAFNIIQDRITRSRLAGDPPDILIDPKLTDIGLFEFDRAADAISIGYESTHRALSDIQSQITALG